MNNTHDFSILREVQIPKYTCPLRDQIRDCRKQTNEIVFLFARHLLKHMQRLAPAVSSERELRASNKGVKEENWHCISTQVFKDEVDISLIKKKRIPFKCLLAAGPFQSLSTPSLAWAQQATWERGPGKQGWSVGAGGMGTSCLSHCAACSRVARPPPQKSGDNEGDSGGSTHEPTEEPDLLSTSFCIPFPEGVKAVPRLHRGEGIRSHQSQRTGTNCPASSQSNKRARQAEGRAQMPDMRPRSKGQQKENRGETAIRVGRM